MKDLLEAILYGIETGLRAARGDREGSSDHLWKIYLSAILGVFFAYTLVKLFGMDPYQVWPYITGLVVGVVYGACWYIRDSG